MADSGHCIVIGAGVAGLSAARRLQQNGISTIVVDEGRQVGGRLATRRFGNALCDYGAHVISASGPEMICTIDEWRDAGVVRVCDPVKSHPALGAELYCGVRGMNSIAAHMARGLDVRSSWHAISVGWDDGNVIVRGKTGETLSARSVLLTAPMPQSLALLDAGDVSLDDPDLARIEYSRCITVLATIEGETNVPTAGGMWFDTEPIQWIVDNRKKGIAIDVTTVTIHSGPAFGEEHWDTDDENIVRMLTQAASRWIGDKISETHVHRWRYAYPVRKHPKTFQLVDRPGLMAFAGDGFAGHEIEGARLSGIAAAEAIIQRL
ncbi:MAG: FAD-dependent oxidoreductase [Candidatus Zixiibacteriota bacterium]